MPFFFNEVIFDKWLKVSTMANMPILCDHEDSTDIREVIWCLFER